MSALKTPPLYAVCDRRQDGRQRVLKEFVDPIDARRYADTLRSVSDPAEVLLLSALPDETDH